jgi:hypothetical protein
MPKKEKLTTKQVKGRIIIPVCYRYVTAQLSKNKTKTPVEVFDAQPYVHFQRQLYFAKKLKFEIPDGLENVKLVGPVGIRRIEMEKLKGVTI